MEIRSEYSSVTVRPERKLGLGWLDLVLLSFSSFLFLLGVSGARFNVKSFWFLAFFLFPISFFFSPPLPAELQTVHDEFS